MKWAGVDLRDLLAETDVNSEATHIWAFGLDHGEFAGKKHNCYPKDTPLRPTPVLGDEDGAVVQQC